MPLLISGGRIIDPQQGIDVVGDIAIVDSKIAQIGDLKAPFQHYTELSAKGMVVCPGFVDLHCHLREPGFEEKETIATGTRAAARGGFTTICCMANTDPPIDSPAKVEYVKHKARTEGVVRVLPIGAITKGQQGEELVEMGRLAEAGVVAFSDDGKPVMNSRLMRHALEYSCLFGLAVIDHCEDISLTEGGVMNEGWVATKLGLRGIPAAAEEIMVARDIALAQLTGARLHIAHVSTAGSVELIRHAKENYINISAEVAPHHLILTEEKVMGYDTNAKMKPPLRTKKDVEALLQGLRDGVIDIIATDHSPHTLVDKQCEFDLAAFGISGFETALGSLMSLVHSGEIELIALISKLTTQPAKILQRANPAISFDFPVPDGLGTLRVGAPGDVTIFDPDLEWVVEPSQFASKGKNTPWKGCLLKGKVVATVVGGEVVYRDNLVELETNPHGRLPTNES